MAGPKVFECPSCGSPLSTSGDEAEIHCGYCGRTIIVPQELRNPPLPPQTPALTPEQMLGAGIAEAIKAREAQTPVALPRKRRGGGCGCGGLLFVGGIILALALVSQIGSPKTAGRAAATLAGAVGFQPTPPPVVVSRPLQAGLPRSARYANLDFTVTKADISNRIPSGSSQTPRYATDKAYAYISTNIKNPLTDKSVYMSDGELHLQLADGNQYNDVNGWMDNIDQQSAKEVDFVFQVPPNARWQGAKLVLGTNKTEQTVLPLDGQAPAAQYPVKLTPPPPTTVEAVTYKVTSAAEDVDYAGKRVDAGKRYLILNFVINNQNSAPGGIVISGNSFRAIAGDTPLAPLDAPIEAVAPNSTLEGQVAFVVPADARLVDLQVGEVGKSTANVPINVQP